MKKTGAQPCNPAKLDLSSELLDVQHLMPTSPDDLARLRESIKQDGIRDALKVYRGPDRRFKVLAGATRLAIARELGLEEIPIEILTGSEQERRTFVIQENLARRHLTTAQKTELVRHLIKQNPELSNRAIGRQAGVDNKTAARVRNDLESSAEIPQTEKRVGMDGRRRTVAPLTSKKEHIPRENIGAKTSEVRAINSITAKGIPFLVLRCHDLEQSRAFYESLGLKFTEEQHGNGPMHYAAEVGPGLILELYPLRDISDLITIGIPGAAKQSLIDPDGRSVRVFTG